MSKTKKLIITRADEYTPYTTFTHPSLRRYADQVGADFQILSGPEKAPESHFRIFKCFNLLDEYDRILHLDSDIIIRKNCPNLFEFIDETKIGTILEDKGSRQDHRRQLMKQIQEERGSVNWTEGYNNTGVFMVSKMHKEIFNVNLDSVWRGFGEDDVELGYQIHKLGFEIQELPYTLNHMSMFSEPWNESPSRFDSYIIHYAGNGFFSFMKNVEEIEQDINLLGKLGEVF